MKVSIATIMIQLLLMNSGRGQMLGLRSPIPGNLEGDSQNSRPIQVSVERYTDSLSNTKYPSTTDPSGSLSASLSSTLLSSSSSSSSSSPVSSWAAKGHNSSSKVSQPILEYFRFLRDNNTPTPEMPSSWTAQGAAYPKKFTVWVGLLGVGCFLCGMLMSSLLSLILYRRKRMHWRRRLAQKRTDPEQSKVGDRAPHSRFFRYKEGLVSEDIKTALASICHQQRRSLFQRLNNLNTGEGHFCETLSTYRGSDPIFVNQFSGILKHDEAGSVSHPESRVQLLVVPGTVSKTHNQQVFLNVALNGDHFNIKMSDNDIQLSPVVECLAPGVKKFRKPVTIVIPHRADLSHEMVGKLKFSVLWSTSTLGRSMTWQDVPHQQLYTNNNKFRQKSPMFFRYDQEHVYIHTDRCGTFTCVGRAGDHCLLRLAAVTYANVNSGGGDQNSQSGCTNLRLYVCDNYLDAFKGVSQMECLHRGRRVSRYVAMTSHSQQDWVVNMVSAQDSSWTWTLKSPETKCISPASGNFCCGIQPPVEFSCEPQQTNCACPAILQGTLSIAQRSTLPGEVPRSQLVQFRVVMQDMTPDDADQPVDPALQCHVSHA